MVATRSRRRGKSPSPAKTKKKSKAKPKKAKKAAKKAAPKQATTANGVTNGGHAGGGAAHDGAEARRLADLSAWQLLARGHVARAVWRASGGALLTKQGAHSLVLWSYLSDPDPSVLAPYIYPFWTGGAGLLPRCSPNVVTLTGFTTIVFMAALVQHTCGAGLDCSAVDGYDAFAGWLFATVIACVWIYQTADAMDGCMGRRTSMYVHPSTELFDHGVDSVVAAINAVTSVSLLGLGPTRMGILHFLAAMSAFYLSTYEHLHVGRLHFGKGFANPTEGLVMVLLTYALYAAWPRALVDHTVADACAGALGGGLCGAPASWPLVGGAFGWVLALPLNHALVLVEVVGVLQMVATVAGRIAERGRPGVAGRDAAWAYAPLLVAWAFGLHWFGGGAADGGNAGALGRARALLVLLAATVSLATLRLIISEMAKSTYPAGYLAATSFAVLGAGHHAAFTHTETAVAPAASTLVWAVAGFALVRFAGFWLRFQHELIHYTGMGRWWHIQAWPMPADGPNAPRAAERIEWLGAGGGDIKEGVDPRRTAAPVAKRPVPLLP